MPKYQFEFEIDYDLFNVGCCVCPYSRRYHVEEESECILTDASTYGGIKYAEEELFKQCPLVLVETNKEIFERKVAEQKKKLASMSDEERSKMHEDFIEGMKRIGERLKDKYPDVCGDDFEDD